MNLKSYSDKCFRINDCVCHSGIVTDYGWGSERFEYKGIIIDMSDQLISVLFTDGDVRNFKRSENKLRLLDIKESLAVGEKILKILTKIDNQNIKIEEQKLKINDSICTILQ